MFTTFFLPLFPKPNSCSKHDRRCCLCHQEPSVPHLGCHQRLCDHVNLLPHPDAHDDHAYDFTEAGCLPLSTHCAHTGGSAALTAVCVGLQVDSGSGVWVYLTTLLTISLRYFHAIFASGLSTDTLFFGLSFYCVASAIRLTCSNKNLRERLGELLCRGKNTNTPARSAEDKSGATATV